MTQELPYRTNWEHLVAELERVTLLARLEYLRLRAEEPTRFEDHFRGLRITQPEVEAALCARGRPAAEAEGSLLERLGLLEEETARRRGASLAAGVELRLERLARLFGLDEVSRDCLLISLAPEVEPRFEKIYAYLQDDVSKRTPRVQLVFDLLRLDGERRLEARGLFGPGAPLIRYRLLRLLEPQASLLGRGLRIEERVVDYLLGADGLGSGLAPAVRLAEGRDRLPELILPASLVEQLGRVEEFLAGGGELPVVFCGLAGTGKKSAAEGLCARIKRPLLICDLRCLALPEGLAEAVPLLLREAILREAAVYLDGLEVLGADPRPALKAFWEELDGFRHPVFLGLNLAELPPWWEPACLPLQFPLPSYGEGARIWRAALGERPELGPLANKFRLSGGQVRQAILRARGLSVLEAESGLSLEALHRACRLASNVRLSELARRIAPRYGWADIVLPEDARRQLREICDQLRHRHVVYEDWGFGRTAPRGKGLTALFVGESGTGKTMAAEIMAAELGLDLYKIDLSSVVSKYIGETEKNLERIFTEAQHSNAILFFDEADAVFGKRSEVKDAHDRYANIEISYLLQRMEDYEGIVILASNLRANIDDAFTRRMNFVVEFPFPEVEDRLAIWEKMFPAEAPRAAEIDFGALAGQLKIAGGNIRNIAHMAAFLAAADGGRIGLSHIRHAVRREFQKMGRLPLKADLEAGAVPKAAERGDFLEERDEESRRRGH
jgi:AAA+ superfamily predicted ATPase